MTSAFVTTGTVLDRILARTAADVAARKEATPVARLELRATGRAVPVSLRAHLRGPELRVIAEIKRASPSRGRFPVEIEPAAVAGEYLAGGAAALSVLTDAPFFQGSLADLAAAAAVAHDRIPPAPVLRKDFVVDEYQLIEALAFGADAVLLIVGALDQRSLVRLLRATRDLGLEALVEVHYEAELARAAEAGADLIGINNRDLRTFDVDLAVTERLAPLAPPGALLVGESGIFEAGDAARLAAAGIEAILVGESLIVAPDRSAAVRALASVPTLVSRGGAFRP
jgi:indole-3-glycerol phosphate synthase